MKARLLGFGRLEIDGRVYERDVVIDRGSVRKRRKGPSKQHRDAFGHTPLSPDEELPWGGARLIVGTGADGRLPVMPEVLAEARRRRVEVIAVPTDEACQLIGTLPAAEVHAILHVTC